MNKAPKCDRHADEQENYGELYAIPFLTNNTRQSCVFSNTAHVQCQAMEDLSLEMLLSPNPSWTKTASLLACAAHPGGHTGESTP